ncbi:MAG: hypothetical protein M1812_003966 [Candelaria pacifica]|nr:MAG: hypothetical protein M1812_003966 [Candelaria pacifica]
MAFSHSHSTSSITNHAQSLSTTIGPTEEVTYNSEIERHQHPSGDPNEQKGLEHGGILGDMEKEYEPIGGRTRTDGDSNPANKSKSRPQSTRSGRSLVSGADFYTCSSGEEEQQRRQTASGKNSPVDPEKSYEVHWDGDNDPMNPRSTSKSKKWLYVIILSSSSILVTCTSSIYTSTYAQLTEEFHCSRIVATLGLSLFVVGLGLGPMLLAPLSEFYGRRPIYIVSFAMFLIWLIPCATANNIQTMLIGRFFNGLAGSAFLSVAGGTVGDLFVRSELQAPMMIYTASPFVGPELGPLLGGFINQYTNWRWTFYVLLIWSAVNLISIIALVPETYHPVMLRQKARNLRRETGNSEWKAPIEKTTKTIPQTILLSVRRPFELLIFEPMCLNLCIFSAILLGVLYLFFGAFELVFVNNHGFSLHQVGLTFLGLFVGMLAGISTDPLFHRYYEKLVRRREEDGGEPGGAEPEYRLPPAIVGAVLVPIGLFCFGWTTYSSVHWIVPIIGSAVFGMGYVNRRPTCQSSFGEGLC